MLGAGSTPVVTNNTTVAPDGTTTADTIVFSTPAGASDGSLWYQPSIPCVSGATYTGGIWVKASAVGDVGKVILFRHANSSGLYMEVTLTDTWQLVSRSEVAAAATTNYQIGLRPNWGGSSGTVTVHVWGASFVNASDAALPYQRVNTSTDYDYDFSKFPPYLKFDGVDDSLYSAASVDFTSTDKMTVFAGLHKASDAAFGTVFETSTNATITNGALLLGATNSGNPNYYVGNRGTVLVSAGNLSTVPAPITSVISVKTDIAADVTEPRHNTVVYGSSSGDLGTGNYGNHVLYIGRRANASLPFSGRIYQLAVKGKAMTAAEISTVEAFVNSKTKAF